MEFTLKHIAFKEILNQILKLLFIIDLSMPLKLLELQVPAYVPLGSHAQLSCSWELGPVDVLYSVKWYKDGREFFRHVPRNVEQTRRFPLPGVDVQDFNVIGSRILLSRAVQDTGGRYRCEVSGERPLFHTVSGHADMIIVVVPEHGPTLSGLHSWYEIGERVQLSCTSGRSRPATRLAWYINGEPAPPGALMPLHTSHHTNGLETTMLGLDFNTTQQQFRNNCLKIKCLATIGSVYWRSTEGSLLKGKSKLYPIQDNLKNIETDLGILLKRTSSNSVSYISKPIFIIFIYIFMNTLQCEVLKYLH